MTRLAEVRLERRGEVQVAYIEGEIDLSNAEEIGAELEASVPNSVESLVVDLSGTTHLDSAGFRLLYTLKRQLDARGQDLRLVVPEGGLILKVISITGLDEAVSISPTVDEAIQAKPQDAA